MENPSGGHNSYPSLFLQLPCSSILGLFSQVSLLHFPSKIVYLVTPHPGFLTSYKEVQHLLTPIRSFCPKLFPVECPSQAIPLGPTPNPDQTFCNNEEKEGRSLTRMTGSRTLVILIRWADLWDALGECVKVWVKGLVGDLNLEDMLVLLWHVQPGSYL